MKDTITADSVKVNLISIGAIGLILLVNFRSLSLPVLLLMAPRATRTPSWPIIRLLEPNRSTMPAHRPHPSAELPVGESPRSAAAHHRIVHLHQHRGALLHRYPPAEGPGAFAGDAGGDHQTWSCAGGCPGRRPSPRPSAPPPPASFPPAASWPPPDKEDEPDGADGDEIDLDAVRRDGVLHVIGLSPSGWPSSSSPATWPSRTSTLSTAPPR